MRAKFKRERYRSDGELAYSYPFAGAALAGGHLADMYAYFN